jgi:hypothetical protein
MLRRAITAYRNSYLKWRLDNLPAERAYRQLVRPLQGESARVLADLNRDGIAIAPVETLLGSAAPFQELKRRVEELETEQAEALTAARAEAATIGEKKTFIYNVLGDRPVLDPTSIFVRFALQPQLLQIANAYFGLCTQLRFYNVWHTFATDVPARRSQLWHRDPEDRLILKAFVYLSDVDEGAGPFTYAAGTHPKGPRRKEAEYFYEANRGARRSNDEQMAKVVPPERWIPAVGAAGTIIFADTRGYHKGGLARTSDRLMYNCMYVSPASRCREFFERQRVDFSQLSTEQALALRTSVNPVP